MKTRIKLPFFPTPYPDELLYSVFARYHEWSGNTCPTQTLVDLFGGSTYTSFELATHVRKLMERLPQNTLNTAGQLIFKHTLLPLYRPFLPKETNARLNKLIMGPNHSVLIHNVLGYAKSNIKPRNILRYCSQCVTSDELHYGEPYWHRDHQAFGVFVCRTHHIKLCESSVAFNDERSRYAYIPLSRGLVNEQKETAIDYCNANDHSLRIAEAVQWILGHDIPIIGLDELCKRYRYFFKVRGLTTFSGAVRERKVAEQFNVHFGGIFLRTLSSAVDIDDGDNWLTDLTRKPKHTIHPIRHILAHIFLGLKQDDFWCIKNNEYRPFGKGPWPCLNPAADHYRQFIINECTMIRSNKTGGPIGHFRCSCGFVYSRIGPDSTKHDIYRKSSVLLYGAVWLKKISRLHYEENMSLRLIAKEMNVCHHTIRNHLSDSKIVFHPRQKGNDNKPERAQRKQQARNLIKSAIELQPQLRRVDLRRMYCREYHWLYRNDPLWLEAILPVPRAPEDNLRVKSK
jgi:hypothetical protein